MSMAAPRQEKEDKSGTECSVAEVAVNTVWFYRTMVDSLVFTSFALTTVMEGLGDKYGEEASLDRQIWTLQKNKSFLGDSCPPHQMRPGAGIQQVKWHKEEQGLSVTIPQVIVSEMWRCQAPSQVAKRWGRWSSVSQPHPLAWGGRGRRSMTTKGDDEMSDPTLHPMCLQHPASPLDRNLLPPSPHQISPGKTFKVTSLGTVVKYLTWGCQEVRGGSLFTNMQRRELWSS